MYGVTYGPPRIARYESIKTDEPEITTAREAIGTVKNAAFVEQFETVSSAAISGFLKVGDLREKGLDDNGHNASY
jgi:hypothetical protein